MLQPVVSVFVVAPATAQVVVSISLNPSETPQLKAESFDDGEPIAAEVKAEKPPRYERPLTGWELG